MIRRNAPLVSGFAPCLLAVLTAGWAGTCGAQDPGAQDPKVQGGGSATQQRVEFGKASPRQEGLLEHVDVWDLQNVEGTKKVFTHIDSPDGAVRLTKGAGGDMPHHRGLFVGYNRCRFGEQRLDFWHCPVGKEGQPGPTIRHQRYLSSAELDPHTEAWRANAVDRVWDRTQRFGADALWLAPDGTPWVREQRIVHAVADAGMSKIYVDVTLTALVGPLQLDGDPHHAGLQVRMAQELHDRQSAWYLRSEDAVDEGNDIWSNCDSAVLVGAVGGRWFAVGHYDHPENPQGRYSTRNYGRFGSCAPVNLAEGETVRLRACIVTLDLSVIGVDDRTVQGLDFAKPDDLTVKAVRRAMHTAAGQ